MRRLRSWPMINRGIKPLLQFQKNPSPFENGLRKVCHIKIIKRAHRYRMQSQPLEDGPVPWNPDPLE